MEGNAQEFDSLLEQEKGKLWAQAMSLTRKSEDAEDLFQETLMKAYNNWESFESGTNFRAWTSRIMLNTHINNINRRRDTNDCDFSDREYENFVFRISGDFMSSYAENPEKIFFDKHIDGRIEEMFYALPDVFRIPFSLFHFEGYLYEDIARMLNLPIGTVKSRIFRARRILKEMILAGAVRH